MKDDALRAEVRAEISRQNLTRNELADALGIHRQTLWNLINGDVTLVNDNFASLLDTLDLELVIKKKP